MAAVTAAVVTAGAAAATAYTSNRNARATNRQAQRSSQSQVQWEQEQYDEWKSVYGDLEQNLADYYNGLSAEEATVENLEAFQLERDTAMTNVRETLAQRGIEQSGIAGAVEIADQFSSAEQRAQIRKEAPREVAREKSQFLQVGLGSNPSSNVSLALGQQAARDEANARSATAASGQATIAAIGSTVNAIETIQASRNQQTQQVGGQGLIDAPTNFGTDYSTTA